MIIGIKQINDLFPPEDKKTEKRKKTEENTNASNPEKMIMLRR